MGNRYDIRNNWHGGKIMTKKRACPICGTGNLVAVEDILSDIEGFIFVEKGERCDSCGEEYISEQEGEKMIKVAKRLNIWGKPLKLYRKLSKSGRGTILRIPADLERDMGLQGNETVTLSKVGKKKILIEIESSG